MYLFAIQYKCYMKFMKKHELSTKNIKRENIFKELFSDNNVDRIRMLALPFLNITAIEKSHYRRK